MGKLDTTYNLKKDIWTIDSKNISPNKNHLHISFTNENAVCELCDIQFGFELRFDQNIITYGIYPPPGYRYKKTDQDFLVSTVLHLKPDNVYSLFLWVKIEKQSSQQLFKLQTPKPKQPYESWYWSTDDKLWMAPKPKPDNLNDYAWDENTLSWKFTDNNNL